MIVVMVRCLDSRPSLGATQRQCADQIARSAPWLKLLVEPEARHPIA